MRGKSVRYASLAAIGIGLMSGTIAMMTIPAAAPAARRAYFFFQNLTYWTLWALLMPVAVFAATAIRSRR